MFHLIASFNLVSKEDGILSGGVTPRLVQG